jgi:peroxiredoxin family protein
MTDPQGEGERQRAGGRGSQDSRMTIVAWSGDLDRVWPQLILATTGAAYGMQVTIFFTFWGLFVLKRPDVRITGDNWMTRMMSAINRGSTDHLPLSRMHFAGMGPKMMKTIAEQHKVASPAELLDTARDMGVRLWPCGMTMDLMGLTSADLIADLPEPVGAAAAVAEMQKSQINLFI